MTTRGDGTNGRDLDWDGCWNVRDFGGLPMAGGGETPPGRIVRGDSPERLSPAGWEALWGYGVRTIIDMRRVDECALDVVRPQGLDAYRVSWDDYPDQDWNDRHVPPGLPGSMRAFLRDYPVAIADTARLLTNAAPGAVLVHCAGGRDRTGLFAIVLGALVGVEAQALYDDYRHSLPRLIPLFRQLGRQDEIDFLESEAQAERRAQVLSEVRSVIDELDTAMARRVLLDGGLAEHEIDALHARITGAPTTS
ncbi:MAG: tyrosine-protein phosphatase [Catenulispora sp.]|nr:tyrosine-protein phosphatase [Catenulispora sp.]